jgi:3-methylcrotonyl-CoA carboxylase alpha subunit
MFRTLLIANRGEIARRIIRTARRLGIRTIAVFSEADRKSPFVREADEAHFIGPAVASESYLNAGYLLSAAALSGAEAIHPGYGFLSENADFAQAVEEAGLIWVGAPAPAIRSMGTKDAAKRLMAAAGVPTTPGYHGEDQAAARLEREAAAIGYPVLIKAVAGGGGKGMRRVDHPSEFAENLQSCQREALASFGDDRVLLETYVRRPRHIEVQVFGDHQGQVIHLFERDCSLQRRHQKVIEEAPAPGMNAATRQALCDIAVRAAKAVNYVGAGTIEFIADASEGLRPDRIWFMEMNTRLQVEHPVTEMITGLDLVEWQLRIASGEPLPLAQDEIRQQGWAMEARLYAEAPETGFLPSTGRLEHFRLPDSGLRVDSAVEEGGEVSTFYDPMIAKLISHGQTRDEAASQLGQACQSVEVWPVKTNAAFLARCLAHPDFLAADIDTGFIGERLDALIAIAPPSTECLQAAAQHLLGEEDSHSQDVWSPWTGADGAFGLRLNSKPEASIMLDWGQGRSLVDIDPEGVAFPLEGLISDAGDLVMFEAGQAYRVQIARHKGSSAGGSSDGSILAPMPGKILTVSAAAGDRVSRGQTLIVLEAMKMEHGLKAPYDGIVTELKARVGNQVVEGLVLAIVAPVE